MPNQSENVPISVRVPPSLREAATAKAERHGETVSDVVREALADYVRPHMVPGDTVYLSRLESGRDGLYVVEEGPIHGVLPDSIVALRRVEP